MSTLHADQTGFMPNWLGQRAALTPERKAVCCHNRTVTFQALDQMARQAAVNMMGLGVKRDDRIALLMHNSLEYAVLYHAISYVGAVAVPLNVRLSEAEIKWQVQDSGACCVIHDDELGETADGVRRSLSDFQVVNGNELTGHPVVNSHERSVEPPSAGSLDQLPLAEEISLQAVYTVIYTSGTTGRPKGVRLTYGNHWWSAVGSALNLGLTEHDHWLAPLPLFHVGGLSILLRSVIYGIPVTIMRRFDAAAANTHIIDRGVSIVSVVSAMLSAMLDNLEQRHAVYPPSLRCMLTGGGSIPRPLLERSRRWNVPVVQTYGMTETASQIVTLAPQDMFRKLGSAGKPLFPARVKIMTARGRAVACREGEIAVKGPMVMAGYAGSQADDDIREADGWFRTGDFGYMDEEGYLYVLDRRSDLIISGGENVYPAEIEGVLTAHPGVVDAGVTAIPDEKWGQVPVACVVLDTDWLSQHAETWVVDLQRHCQHQLARYKIPKKFFQVEKLPRNASQKLQRHRLPSLVNQRF